MSTEFGYQGDDPTLMALQEKAEEIEKVGYLQSELGEAVPGEAEESFSEDDSEDSDYESMTVEELKDLARDRDISGFSTMNKAELIEALEA